MKKIIILILVLSFLSGCTFQKTNNEVKETFVVLEAAIDEILETDRVHSYARYKDTLEPITLSAYYNGKVYATVPIENSLREIEAFIPETVKFTDYKKSRPEFHNVNELSKTGVIKGNENGEARPFDPATRSEVAVMLMRFLGINPETDSNHTFSDLNKNDSNYGYIVAAYNRGIVSGDTKTEFLPEKNISREELTVMVARALKYAGLRCPESSRLNIVDKDSVSDWAKESYEYVGRAYISDYDDSDPSYPVRVYNPLKDATRADVAYILENTKKMCQLYASDTAKKYGFDKEMPVIDGSTSTYPFTQMVYGNLFWNGNTHPLYPEAHSKSYESYKRLINKEVDMLFASVYPSSDILKYAEEKKTELELIPVANDAMIFFTNSDNKAEGLTKEQISEIYVNNAYSNWKEIGGPDALLYPYCRNDDSGSHAQMEKHFLNGNEINKQIRNKTISESMSDVLTDVMRSKTKRPLGYGLGYSIYYYFNNMDVYYNTKTELKLLKVDGVYPDSETIANGTYPLSNNTYVVIRKDSPANSPERKMVEFMLTDEGQMCVELAGFGRLYN